MNQRDQGLILNSDLQHITVLEEAHNLLRRTSIEALLVQDDNAEKKYVPSLLRISRDGEMALVFDDVEDVEAGIAVCLTPKFEILSVDEYL